VRLRQTWCGAEGERAESERCGLVLVQPDLRLCQFPPLSLFRRRRAAAAQEAVKDDPRVQEAMRRRGVTDMSMLMVDAWCSGFYTDEDHPRNRRSRPLLFVRTGDGQDNGYARPVEGITIVVDHSTFTVRLFLRSPRGPVSELSQRPPSRK